MQDQGVGWGRSIEGWAVGALVGVIALGGVACSSSPERSNQSQVSPGGDQDAPAVVDIATAGSATDTARVYTGTTRPERQVSLRSQAEGRLLSLGSEVGDVVTLGQVVGTLDDSLLQTVVGEAEAELAARQFEVAEAEAELADIRTAIEAARVRFQQAENDAQRLNALANQGAVATQEAEQAQTTLRTAEQALRSSEEQVRTRQQAVAAAQKRVEAQRSILRESQQRLAFANLNSPLAGVVLERLAEPGDLILPGEAVLTLGDLSTIRVVVQVADSNLGEFRLGQAVNLQLDALPGESFNGQVVRISPVADPTSRLVPIEIAMTNPGGRVGSGLLVRVTASAAQSTAVVVPESALETTATASNQIFVVTGSDSNLVVEARSVQLGEAGNGSVTILAGLAPGERYVVRSSQPLQSGQVVEASLLSESQG